MALFSVFSQAVVVFHYWHNITSRKFVNSLEFDTKRDVSVTVSSQYEKALLPLCMEKYQTRRRGIKIEFSTYKIHIPSPWIWRDCKNTLKYKAVSKRIRLYFHFRLLPLE